MKTIAITVKSFARTTRKIVGEDADVVSVAVPRTCAGGGEDVLFDLDGG